MGKTARFYPKAWVQRILSGLLVMILLLSAAVGTAGASGSAKNSVSRAIAIVFDNSGSMYMSGNKAWCRATYAIEVFASMMNQGDTLQVFPMYEVTANGKSYTSQSPVTVSGGSDISAIRDMYTPTREIPPLRPSGTPIRHYSAAPPMKSGSLCSPTARSSMKMAPVWGLPPPPDCPKCSPSTINRPMCSIWELTPSQSCPQ